MSFPVVTAEGKVGGATLDRKRRRPEKGTDLFFLIYFSYPNSSSWQ